MTLLVPWESPCWFLTSPATPWPATQIHDGLEERGPTTDFTQEGVQRQDLSTTPDCPDCPDVARLSMDGSFVEKIFTGNSGNHRIFRLKMEFSCIFSQKKKKKQSIEFYQQEENDWNGRATWDFSYEEISFGMWDWKKKYGKYTYKM